MFKERIVTVIVAFILFGLFPLVLFRMLAFPRANAEMKQGVQRNLEGMISKQKDILTMLWDNRKSHARAISDTIQSELIIHGNEDFVGLMNVKNEHEYLRLKTQLECMKADYGYKGIFICNGAGVVQAVTENEKFLLGMNIMKEKIFSNIQETLNNGKTYISDVIHLSLNDVKAVKDGKDGKENDLPSMFMFYPIKGSNRNVLGSVVLWMDTSILTKAMESVALGKTGEAYLVNKDGVMITESRFSEHIQKSVDTCRTCHKVVDPDTNLLTKGVKRCISEKNIGYDLEGYRDYDGLKVVGAWGWLKDSNMGLIVEIDADEALGAVNNLNFMVKSLMMVIIIPAFVIAVLMYRKLNTGYMFKDLSLPKRALIGMATVMVVGFVMAIVDRYELSRERGYLREQKYKVHNPLNVFGSIVTQRDEDFIRSNISKFKKEFIKGETKPSVEKTVTTWE